MKLPKLPSLFKLKPKKRLNAATATRRVLPTMDDYADEPQTKLSSAFVVVLILHVVAVGGIYAFNSIKANRRAQEPLAKAAASSLKTASLSAPAASSILPRKDPVERTPAGQSAIVSPISGGRIHHVNSGDNIARVAQLYSVSIADLEEANGAKNVASLHPGQVLNIPRSRPAAMVAKKSEETPKVVAKKIDETPKVGAIVKAAPKTYVVAKGDNPVAIARRHGVAYDELLKLNKIEDPKKLKVGQTLKLPPKKT